MAYRSWCLTFRPKEGITDDQIDAISQWLQKADWHIAVLHNHGEARHMHMSVWLEKSTTKSNLNNRFLSIKGIEGTLSSVEQKVFRAGTKIQYNSDFVCNYMQTHDDPRVVTERLPECKLEDNATSEILCAYYPEPDDTRAKREFKGTPWYVEMEKKWHEAPPQQITEESVKIFVHHHMFVARTIHVIDDPKRLAHKIAALVKFLWKTDLAPRARFNPY